MIFIINVVNVSNNTVHITMTTPLQRCNHETLLQCMGVGVWLFISSGEECVPVIPLCMILARLVYAECANA